MRFLKVFLSCALAINYLIADETEEIISVASYIDSGELSASPVDVISAEEFNNKQKNKENPPNQKAIKPIRT